MHDYYHCSVVGRSVGKEERQDSRGVEAGNTMMPFEYQKRDMRSGFTPMLSRRLECLDRVAIPKRDAVCEFVAGKDTIGGHDGGLQEQIGRLVGQVVQVVDDRDGEGGASVKSDSGAVSACWTKRGRNDRLRLLKEYSFSSCLT